MTLFVQLMFSENDEPCNLRIFNQSLFTESDLHAELSELCKNWVINLAIMVVIVGSKKATPKLLELVPQEFQDLTKFYKKDEINSMYQWILKQPHLPKLSEDQLMVFLHAGNYSVEKAKDIIDNYYTLRTRASDLFTNRNPDKVLARAFTIAYFVCLPESVKTHNGNQLLILKLKDTDPANADFVEGVKTTFALIDITVGKYPLCKGIEIVMDMEGLALGHLTKVDFSALRVFMSFCQYALPASLKAVHVINTFSLINQVMALIKPLLNVELLNKITFFSPNEFNKFTSKCVPLESLPREFGGSLESINKYQDETFRHFQLATEWFEELEKYKVDESKRLGRRRSDLNVCDGSFKKLELD